MPTLKYWDGAAYQPLAAAASIPAGGSQGQVLQKNSASSYDVVWASGAPVQPPPPTGFNTFTDGSGEVWVSLNGSAWKKARDVLHAKVYRNTPYTFPVAPTAIPYDTVDSDPFLLYTSPNFKAPIAGMYQVAGCWGCAGGSTGWVISIHAFKNGVTVGNGTTLQISAGGSWIGPHVSTVVRLAAGDTVAIASESAYGTLGSAAYGLTGMWATFDYLGTG
jgi:hypothetical protein